MSKTSAVNTTNFPSDILFDNGVSNKSFPGVLNYRKDATPNVTSVSPKTGDVYGNYPITITGVNLNISTPTVNIDGVNCLVQTSTATSIVCLVGARLTLPKKVFFEVKVGARSAALKAQFTYVMRWSDPRTWGTDLPPIDDDLVYVPPGMHLLVDQNTPKLNGIVVENGTI